MPGYTVVMESQEFGREFYQRDTLEDALGTIANLVKSVEVQNDGVERMIGIAVNNKQPIPWLWRVECGGCGKIDFVQAPAGEAPEKCTCGSTDVYRYPEEKPCPECDGTMIKSRGCGVFVCLDCEHHDGLERCFCGWSASGGDGRAELVERGENIEEE